MEYWYKFLIILYSPKKGPLSGEGLFYFVILWYNLKRRLVSGFFRERKGISWGGNAFSFVIK